LWFIYLLPVFFVVTKLTRPLPPLAIWALAAALEMMHIGTGWTVIDEFCAALVISIPAICLRLRVRAVRSCAGRPVLALAGLALWA